MSRGSTVQKANTVVLFDGVCKLCNGSINWIIDHDPQSLIRYLPLQSAAGRALAERAGLDPDVLSTMVAIREGRVMLRSTAALHIATRIRSPMAPVARVLLVIPAVLRDVGYRLLARSRYAVFGKLDACRMPTPDVESRFLDPDDVAGAFRVAGLSGSQGDRVASGQDAAGVPRASAG
ncbi:MAG: DCC1-like thiol-disulfide oxidoreductase family protein [Planctomycetota bacterium]